MEAEDHPEPGHLVKVHLPGEALWAEPLSLQDGKLVARIYSEPVATRSHGYRHGEVVACDDDYGWRAPSKMLN
jgi:hypothetical protein